MHRLGLLLLLALALGLALWRWQPTGEGAPTAAAGTGADPGYVARGATLVDTGEDGLARFSLAAASITQLHPGAEVQLDEPRLDYQGPTHWQLRAHSGTLPQDASSVRFSGAVLATAEREHAPPLRILTESLAVDLQQRRADTAAAVTVELGRNRLAAIGLHADMKADALRLESGVHGEYAR